MPADRNSQTDEKIVRLSRLARGIEIGGHYNVSKVLRAMAYAEEVRAVHAAGIPTGAALHAELTALIDDLKREHAQPDVIAALEIGLRALQTEQANSHEDIPAVYVSRVCGDIYLGETRPNETACDDDPLDLREFRPYYYFDPMPPADLITALRTFPSLILSSIEGLSDDQLNQSPQAGEWSMRELLMHLYVTQGLLLNRAKQILSEDNPVLMGVSAWLMTASEGMTAREVFDQFAAQRAETITLLDPLPAHAWWRPARHSEFGAITLQEHVSYFTRHERSHRKQLVEIVRAVGG